MKKQLVLTKKNDDYILSMKDDVNRNINIVNKVVNGEDLYNVFYENITEENEYILKTTLSDRKDIIIFNQLCACLLYTSPSPRDMRRSRMPSSA